MISNLRISYGANDIHSLREFQVIIRWIGFVDFKISSLFSAFHTELLISILFGNFSSWKINLDLWILVPFLKGMKIISHPWNGRLRNSPIVGINPVRFLFFGLRALSKCLQIENYFAEFLIWKSGKMSNLKMLNF